MADIIRKKKISELETAASLIGFYTVGYKIVNGQPVSVKVLLTDLQEAANLAAYPPRINSSNYWEIWDPSTSQYVSTGVSATGPTGKSAFQEWIDAGGIGDASDFLDYLRQPTVEIGALVKSKGVSMDFGTNEDTIAWVNMYGAMHIKSVVASNCATVKLSYGNVSQLSVTPGTVDIAIPAGAVLVWEIGRTNENQQAALGFQFLENIFITANE